MPRGSATTVPRANNRPEYKTEVIHECHFKIDLSLKEFHPFPSGIIITRNDGMQYNADGQDQDISCITIHKQLTEHRDGMFTRAILSPDGTELVIEEPAYPASYISHVDRSEERRVWKKSK